MTHNQTVTLFNPVATKCGVVGSAIGKAINDFTKHPVTAVASNGKKSSFGGKFDKVLVGMYITKVIYSNPVTVVFFSDGTKTTSRCQPGDTYNKETGLSICVLKKLLSGDQVASLFDTWVTEDKILDLKTIREKKKEVKKSK